MAASLAAVELGVGLAYALFAAASFAMMGGPSAPAWGTAFVLYWASLGGGAALLVAGGALVLARGARRLAAGLGVAGGALLTAWNAWDLRYLPSDVSHGTVDAGALAFEAVLVALAVAADVAALKIWIRARRAA